jgi:hypothetical protein
MRAWYLHRTLGGVKYSFQKRSPQEVENLLYHCLGYRKSYCQHTSTDFDYAYNLALYLQEIAHDAPILQCFEGIKSILYIYRTLDWIPALSRFSLFSLMLETRKLTKWYQKQHQNLWTESHIRTPRYEIFNDNRHEQHAFLWFTDISVTKK